MKLLIINQNAPNKGDRAVFLFILRELVQKGFTCLTVSTSEPRLWRRYRNYGGATIKFVPWSWEIYRGIGTGITGFFMRRVNQMWGRLFRSFLYVMVRQALVKGECPWYVKVLCRICNSKLWKAIKEADAVIATGGHHLTTLLVEDVVCSQVFDMSVARLCRKPLVLWSQSVGPFAFKRETNKKLIEKILNGTLRIYIRDKASVRELSDFGVSSSAIFETVDSVFGLRDMVESSLATLPSQRSAVLGISVYATQDKREEEYNTCINSISALVRRAVESGYKVRFFPMQITSKRETRYIQDIMEKSGHKDACSVYQGSVETSDHLKAVAECRMFVGHKTHSVIFSLISAVPVIALAYHKKTEDFMKQFGLEEYCVADTKLSENRLVEMFDKLNQNIDAVSVREAELSLELDRRVKKDFSELIEFLAKKYH